MQNETHTRDEQRKFKIYLCEWRDISCKLNSTMPIDALTFKRRARSFRCSLCLHSNCETFPRNFSALGYIDSLPSCRDADTIAENWSRRGQRFRQLGERYYASTFSVTTQWMWIRIVSNKSARWNKLSIPKSQRCNRRSSGMDEHFHPTLYCTCDYSSMLESRLLYVGKLYPKMIIYSASRILFSVLWQIRG